MVCQGACACQACHGEGRYESGCATCGKVRPSCERCGGPCRCTLCHGDARRMIHCWQCGRYHPCWGGDTAIFQPDGSTKQVRQCRVGDEVRTLRGFRRITKIWTSDP